MDCLNVVKVIASSFLEALSILLFLKVFREGNQKNKNFFLYGFCLVMAVYIALIEIYGMSRLCTIAGYGVLMVFSIKFYKFPIKNGIFYVCFGIVFVGILELLVYIPVDFLHIWGVDDTIILFIVVAVTCWICNMLSKRRMFPKDWKNILNEEIKGYYYSIVVCAVLIITIMYFHYNRKISFLEFVYLFTAVGIIMVSAYKISVYRRELKLQKEYSQVYGEVVREIRERQHKFTNQLNAVYSLCYLYDSYEELVQKLKEESGVLQNYVMPAKLLVLEEPVVVAHVYQKMCEALDRGIRLEMELSSGVKELGIPEIYLVEVIGNLLDNAMDEVDRRGLGETVYLEIHPEGESVCICVSNEHEKIPHAVYKEFFKRGYSGKGAGRGEGLAYVKKIVHRYRGELEVGNVMRKEKNCFYIKILFPVKKLK